MKRITTEFSVSRDYVAPEMQVVDIYSEGMLCTSGTIEEWGEETLDWD
jgi:hypothetical protein